MKNVNAKKWRLAALRMRWMSGKKNCGLGIKVWRHAYEKM